MGEIDVAATRKREYRDLALSFARNPVTQDVSVITGVDAVKRSIRNILLTNVGEVPFLPNFGSRLTRLLFEPIDPITTSQIDAELRATLQAFEPRAKITSLNVVPTEDEQRYDITLTMTLVNLPDPVTLTLFLNRLR